MVSLLRFIHHQLAPQTDVPGTGVFRSLVMAVFVPALRVLAQRGSAMMTP
jgi:hypothetical protein